MFTVDVTSVSAKYLRSFCVFVTLQMTKQKVDITLHPVVYALGNCLYSCSWELKILKSKTEFVFDDFYVCFTTTNVLNNYGIFGHNLPTRKLIKNDVHPTNTFFRCTKIKHMGK